MLSRGVARKILGANDPLLPFSKFAERLQSTDFNFANLESPLSGTDRISPSGSLIFNAPPRNVEGLVKYNFKVVTLANNHAFDQGVKGIQFTKKFMADNGILAFGTGQTLEDAWTPQIMTVKGLKIGFVGASYASYNDGGIAKNTYVARIEDFDNLKQSIARLKQESDFVVATMHAGIEDTYQPEKPQVDFAHAAIDFGADLVIGHHPHWIQSVEQYKGKYIFYSLGNFIFDQRNPTNKEGLTLKITLQNTKTNHSNPRLDKSVTWLQEIEMIPVLIENFSTPREATEAEAQKILKKLGISERVIKPAQTAG